MIGSISEIRLAGIIVVAGLTMAAGCPTEQQRRVGEAAWNEEVVLRTGDRAVLDEQRFAVTVEGINTVERFSHVALLLELFQTGEFVQDTIRTVWNAELSSASRLPPYSVRVKGFPGADTATLIVFREDPTETEPARSPEPDSQVEEQDE